MGLSLRLTGVKCILLLENILILSFQHVLRLLLPLLVIPLVARSTNSTELGIYMYAVSAAAWIASLLEYGFGISATREITAARGNDNLLRQIVSATQSAKLLLVTFSGVVSVVVWLLVPAIGLHWQWSITAWLLGVLAALQPTYYFQGQEQLRLVGLAELWVSASTFLLLLLLVRTPDHIFRLPIILVATRASSLLFLTMAMQRALAVPWRDMLRVPSGVASLRAAFQIFFFQATVSLYTSFNVIFLGLLMPAEQIGPYATAERLIRAGLGFFGPISTALFSRLSAMRDSNPTGMANTRRRALGWMTALGILAGTLAFFVGPPLAHALLGTKADQVGDIIRTMAWVVPAIALSNTLGFQYLMVNHHERAINLVVLSAVMISLPLSYVLVWAIGSQGMALSWVTVEWFITISLIALVTNTRRKRKKGGKLHVQ